MPKVRDEKKIEEIFKATLKLVIRTGFSGLKMADVAREAKLATGTLYIYFQNKEELINATFIETKKKIAAVILDDQNAAATYFETFRKTWNSYFTFCLKHPEYMLFVEQFIYSGFITENIKTKAESFFEDFNTFLKQGQEQNMLKAHDIELLKAQLMGPIHETIKISVNKKISLNETTIDQCFDMAWQSVRL